MTDFRILSLDGGGIWALLEVMALQDIYGDINGLDILSKFDFVAANSGGAIVLGCLLKDLRPSEIITLLNSPERRNEIFVKRGFLSHPFQPIIKLLNAAGFGYKYDSSQKLVGIRATLGVAVADLKVTDLPKKFDGKSGRRPEFLFCAFNYDTNRGEYFRSNKNSGAASGSPKTDPTLAEAIHASSNAPVNFFDAPAQIGARRYWDGGVSGYNNPSLAAVIEGIRNGQQTKDIKVLALGTASIVLPTAGTTANEDPVLVQAQTPYGLKDDLAKLATAIIDDPPDVATFHAHVMLGAADDAPRLIRMSPIVRPKQNDAGAWILPEGLDRDQFKRLRDLRMDAVAQKDVDLITALGKSWLLDKVPNQPIQMVGATLEAKIPYGVYSLARAAWKSLEI